MMGSLAYLLSKKLVNRIKEALHSPKELVMIIFFAALMCFTVFTGNMSDSPAGSRDINELYAGILALYTLVFIITAKGGFVNGASMFTMADVNLVFTSPKKQSGVLFYGLLSQLGRSLLLGVFILYQYSWVHDCYGIGVGSLVIILVGYGVTVFLSQMVSMLIYCVTSGDDRKNNIAKAVFWTVIGAFFAYVIAAVYLGEDDLVSSAVRAANSILMKFFPVSGFVQLGVVGAISASYTQLLVGILCFAAFCVLYLVLVRVINADYYEDVLKATEVSFSAITARKEGKAVETAPRNVKVGKTGFKKGEGASAIAQKHKIENRRSKFFVTDMLGIIMVTVTAAVGFFSKDAVITFAVNVYIMIFTVTAGRWAKELSLPYVYLIPEPPFKKLLHMIREQLPSLAFESALIFTALYFILRLSVFEAVCFALARISFGLLFIGVNLFLSRLLGSSENKAFAIFLYFLFAALFSLPGVLSAVIICSVLELSLWLAMLSLGAVNAAVALLLIFICRNILECSEYNNK